jgi:hypothetical protein
MVREKVRKRDSDRIRDSYLISTTTLGTLSSAPTINTAIVTVPPFLLNFTAFENKLRNTRPMRVRDMGRVRLRARLKSPTNTYNPNTNAIINRTRPLTLSNPDLPILIVSILTITSSLQVILGSHCNITS